MNPITDFNGEFQWLSNFSPSIVFLDGFAYPTVEHAYQAAKSFDEDYRLRIRGVNYPGRAKKIGNSITIRNDWEILVPGTVLLVKQKVMKDLLIQKFDIPEYKELLLATGDCMICEGNTWGDTYWGVYKGKGENNLGKLIMEIRERIRNAIH